MLVLNFWKLGAALPWQKTISSKTEDCLIWVYSVDAHSSFFLNTKIPLEDGIMEQETSINPFCSIWLATASILAAISFALGEYLTTTVLYIWIHLLPSKNIFQTGFSYQEPL